MVEYLLFIISGLYIIPVLLVTGWFCWTSTILVKEKKERRRRKAQGL